MNLLEFIAILSDILDILVDNQPPLGKIPPMQILKKEKATLFHTTDKKPIDVEKISILLTSENRKLLFTLVIIDIDPQQHTTMYCVGGGSSSSFSLQNIQTFSGIATLMQTIQRVVIFEYYAACPREFDIDTSKVLARILAEKTIEESMPSDGILVVGDSAGAVPAINFIQAMQDTSAFNGNQMCLALFEPVGLTDNPYLLLNFLSTVWDIYGETRMGHSLSQALSEFYLSWALPGDVENSFGELVKDILYKRKKHYKKIAKSLNLQNLSSCNIPLGSFIHGSFANIGKELTMPLNISLLFSNKSLEPVVKRYNHDEGLIKKYYTENIFPRINPEDIQISILNGNHSFLYLPENFSITASILNRALESGTAPSYTPVSNHQYEQINLPSLA